MSSQSYYTEWLCGGPLYANNAFWLLREWRLCVLVEPFEPPRMKSWMRSWTSLAWT